MFIKNGDPKPITVVPMEEVVNEKTAEKLEHFKKEISNKENENKDENVQ